MSAVQMTRHFLLAMRARNWGPLIFVASESGVQIPTEFLHYGVVKAGVIALARGIAETLVASGVTANSVLPGPIFTESTARRAAAEGKTEQEFAADTFTKARPTSLLRRFASTEEVANMIVYLCSPPASATHGAAARRASLEGCWDDESLKLALFDEMQESDLRPAEYAAPMDVLLKARYEPAIEDAVARIDLLGGIGADGIADLYLLMVRLFPPEADFGPTSGFVGPLQMVTSLRDFDDAQCYNTDYRRGQVPKATIAEAQDRSISRPQRHLRVSGEGGGPRHKGARDVNPLGRCYWIFPRKPISERLLLLLLVRSRPSAYGQGRAFGKLALV